jgi:hypothetical protein
MAPDPGSGSATLDIRGEMETFLKCNLTTKLSANKPHPLSFHQLGIFKEVRNERDRIWFYGGLLHG